jgi:hypothetical protein
MLFSVISVHAIAERVVAQDPDAVVRLRLLRDVLQRPADSPELVQARHDVARSHWVQELEREQWSDGSWGRLHSRDYRAQQKIPTTEVGVERALALGLDAAHPVLTGAAQYLERVLEGAVQCRDRPEKNDRWPTGVRLFSAATLAQIQPGHPALDREWDLWVCVARRTFAAGVYDPQAEVHAHRELTGASVKDSYLVLDNKYTLALLGSRAAALPRELERALVNWVWHKPDGMRYMGVELSHPPHPLKAGPLDHWFTSLERLSRFPSWRSLAGDVVRWLWGQQAPGGLWDLGPRPTFSVALPLSNNWRKKMARQYDWTTRILSLLQRHY